MDDVRTKGAIVVWPTTDTSGTPPPDMVQAEMRRKLGLQAGDVVGQPEPALAAGS